VSEGADVGVRLKSPRKKGTRSKRFIADSAGDGVGTTGVAVWEWQPPMSELMSSARSLPIHLTQAQDSLFGRLRH
jgi:hypothetical protein